MLVNTGAKVITNLFRISGGDSNESSPAGVKSTVTLTGENSSLQGDDVLSIGGITPGEMRVQQMATATAKQALMVGGLSGTGGNYTVDGQGTLNITGSGTSVNAADLMVGLFGQGTLNVSDGAVLNISVPSAPSPNIPQTVAGRGFLIGGPSWQTGAGTESKTIAANAVMTVSGSGTQVTALSGLLLGAMNATDYWEGDLAYKDAKTTAILNIADGASMLVDGPIQMGRQTDADDIPDVIAINIGTGGKAGTLKAPVIAGRSPFAQVNFDHTDASAFDVFMQGVMSINHLNTGTTTFNTPLVEPFQVYQGVTSVSKGTLAAGANYVFSAFSAHKTEAGGTLDTNGFDQGLKSLDNAGTVNLPNTAALPKLQRTKAAPGQPGTKLTVADVAPGTSTILNPGQGVYTSNGGTLVIATALGADSSPTDQLIVDGEVKLGSGPTLLEVINAAGAGAATTGNGIEVITVSGASPAGAFALKTIPRAGGFIYSLKQVSNNWYLQSTQAQTQTITFDKQADHAFAAGGSFAVSPAAAASSNLPISYSSGTPAVCTVSGNTVTMVSAGTCTITAEQAGDTAFDPAAPVSQSFNLIGAGTGGGTGGGTGANIAPVPALDGLGLLLASAGLGGMAAFVLRRRQRTQAR